MMAVSVAQDSSVITNTNLLPDREIFVGRVAEAASLETSLREGESLISIIGTSGMGKTRIARHVSLRLAPEFEAAGGVWFCDLSSAQTKEDLLATVAVTLEMPRSVGQDGREFGSVLGDRGRLLLVLDNFETLEPAALPVLSQWLSLAPELQLLVTSLAALGVAGESVFELGPLAAEEAIQLYEERSRKAWAGDRLFASGEQVALRELVRRLDCVPLAIELAAARIRQLPPVKLLSRIEDRFEVLKSRSPRKQSSLESAIDLSWELLTPEERLAMARASVFAGGFTLEAAEEVLAPDPQPAGGGPRRSVLEILESLRDTALIQLSDGDPPRFSSYESTQAFAARELKAAGGLDEAIRRHRSFFLRCGERWAQESEGGPTAQEAIERLMAERENLIAVYRRHLEPDPAIAARAAMAVSVANSRVGLPSLEISLANGAVAAARAAGDRRLLARALRLRWSVMHRQGKLGRKDLDEGLGLAMEAGDRRLQGFIYSDLANFLSNLGDLDEAEQMLERGAEIEREIGVPLLAGGLQLGMSLVADARGQHQKSREHLEAARDLFTLCGSHDRRGRVLVNLGQIYLHDGDFDAARAAIHEAGVAFHLAKQTDAEATARAALGSVERTAGRLEEAEAHLTAALTVLRRFGSRRFQAIIVGNLGIIALEQDQLKLAAQRFQESFELIRDMGQDWTSAQIRPFAGAVKAILGQVDEAREDFDVARHWAEVHEDPTNLAVTSTLEGFLDLALARAAARERRKDEAELHLAEATKKFRSSQSEGTPSSHALINARRLCERALARYADLAAIAGEAPAAAEVHPAPASDEDGQEKTRREDDRATPARQNGAEPPTLLVGPDTCWIEVQGGPRIDLRTRAKSRKLLQALIEQHQLAPGIGLSLEDLMQVGWPRDEVGPTVLANRVYKCVNALRNIGLDELLLRHADGYLLLPSLSISRQRG